MRKFLLTTALVLPLGAGIGWAQDTGAQDTTTGAGDALQQGMQQVGESAATAGDALKQGMQQVGESAATVGTSVTDAVSDMGDTPTGSDAEPGSDDAAGMGAESGAETTDSGDAGMTGDTDTTGGAGMSGDTGMTGSTDMSGDSGMTGDTGAAGDAAAIGAGDMANDTGAMAGASDLEQQQAADELRSQWITDADVTTSDGTKIGDVKDLIITANGEVKAVVVGVGGFLGFGTKDIAIAWPDLDIQNDARVISTHLTKEQAEAAPSYMFRDQQPAPAAPAAPAADESAPQ